MPFWLSALLFPFTKTLLHPLRAQWTILPLVSLVNCQRCNLTFEHYMSFNVEVFTLQCQVQCQWFDWPAGQQTGYKCTGEQDCPLPGGPARGSPLFHHGLFRAFTQMIFLLKFCTWLYLNRYETVLFPFVIWNNPILKHIEPWHGEGHPHWIRLKPLSNCCC